MYRTSFSFFVLILLVAVCSSSGGFDNSHARRSTSLQPIVLQIAASDRAQGTSHRHSNENVAQIPLFPQTKTEFQMNEEK